MAYCTNCGALLDNTARFCPNCGTAVTVVPVNVTTTSPVRTDYKVVLVSRGTCTKTLAVEILNDLLGYTNAEATQIINNVPMATAIDLTLPQAQYIAQAMTEYGMEVAIYNDNGYVNLNTDNMTSVFDNNGGFLSNVAAVLAGITIGNRITRYERWTRPAPVVFRPTYRRTPPRTTYRSYRPAPAPRPVVRPAPAPRPAAAPRAAVRPLPAQPANPGVARPMPAQPARPGAAKPLQGGQPARPASGTGRNGGGGRPGGSGRPGGR